MSEATRRFADKMALAIEPIDKFCHMVMAFPQAGQSPVLDICANALGCTQDIAEAAAGADNPAQEVYRPPTIEDIRSKLTSLATQQHVFLPMLLPGLFSYLRLALSYYGSTAARDEGIDQDLDWLAKFEAYKKLPQQERPSHLRTDEAIDWYIGQAKAKAMRRSGNMAAAREVCARIEDDWNRSFPDTYWQSWLQRMAK